MLLLLALLLPWHVLQRDGAISLRTRDAAQHATKYAAEGRLASGSSMHYAWNRCCRAVSARSRTERITAHSQEWLARAALNAHVTSMQGGHGFHLSQ